MSERAAEEGHELRHDRPSIATGVQQKIVDYPRVQLGMKNFEHESAPASGPTRP